MFGREEWDIQWDRANSYIIITITYKLVFMFNILLNIGSGIMMCICFVSRHLKSINANKTNDLIETKPANYKC